MNTELLTKALNDPVLSTVSKAKLQQLEPQISPKQFSDLVDAQGNQYVEFVQEGGGVWGSAFVGYLYALELFGIRFLKVAGTSAGAINTMLIAACKTKEEPKSETIRNILFDWDFSDFMDGKSYIRTTAHAMLNNKNFIKINLSILLLILAILVVFPFLVSNVALWQLKLVFLLPVVYLSIFIFLAFRFYRDFRKSNSGLNPGKEFLKQMTKVMDGFGIRTVAELNDTFIQTEKNLNIQYRYGNDDEFYNLALRSIEEIRQNNADHIDATRFRIFYESAKNNDYYRHNPLYALKTEYVVITTDINAEIKVQLPTMANLYWSEDELKEISPAEFVRASMSVPFFFEPMQKKINKADPSVQYAWKFWLNTAKEDIFPAGVFIDGGSISNFPIDIFHMNDIFYPRMPLFGVQLTSDEEILSEKGKTAAQILKSPVTFSGNIIGTLRGFNDKSFLTKYSFYRNFSIKTVNCGGSNWLNFFMKREEKEQLFNAGFLAALDFLKDFDWDQYKCERMMVSMKEKKILREHDVHTVG